MTDNTEKDKQLLKNLEKMLAEQEGEITGHLDEDNRTALEFARKMASLREKPTKEFKDNLKVQLIHQLAEQEKNDQSMNETLLFWGMLRSKLWQGTIAAVIAVIIIAVILLIVLLINR
jgi:hypothetical protein